jgi:hypothetical protein
VERPGAGGFSLGEAADLAGKSVGTVRNWCIQHGLSRRVGGGTWVVSKVAFAMFLDGEMVALAAYKRGDRPANLSRPISSVSISAFGQKMAVHHCEPVTDKPGSAELMA